MKQNKTIKNVLEVKEKYICNRCENLGVKILPNQKEKKKIKQFEKLKLI